MEVQTAPKPPIEFWPLRSARYTRGQPNNKSVEVQEVVEKEIKPFDRITVRALVKYGFTSGCPGCERNRRGERARRGHRHTEECRRRLREKMNQDERFKAMLDARKRKFAKYIDRLIEKEEAKKRKAETQAGNVDDMAIEDDKAEDVEVAEARR